MATSSNSRPLVQIAPMLDVTYQDFRYMIRLISKKVQLWSEMHVENTLLYSERAHEFLAFEEEEHPIVCQLGGANPENLRRAVELVDMHGYDEINLNCGCPSDRVCGKGEFGASLMLKAELVRDCIKEMKSGTKTPITVKTRLGVDNNDSEEFTAGFISQVAEGGCDHFIMHSRKAWLKGLSPAQNRSIPPLNYARVFSLCHRFPHLKFSLNGGIKTVDEIKRLLRSPETPPNLVGIMVGRVAYDNPCALWSVDTEIYGAASNPATTRRQILTDYSEYLKNRYPATCSCHGDGTNRESTHSTHLALKPILGMLAHQPGNKNFRRKLDIRSREAGLKYCSPGHIIEVVMAEVDSATLDLPLDPSKCEEPQKKFVFKETKALIDAALEVSRKHQLIKAETCGGAVSSTASSTGSPPDDDADMENTADVLRIDDERSERATPQPCTDAAHSDERSDRGNKRNSSAHAPDRSGDRAADDGTNGESGCGPEWRQSCGPEWRQSCGHSRKKMDESMSDENTNNAEHTRNAAVLDHRQQDVTMEVREQDDDRNKAGEKDTTGEGVADSDPLDPIKVDTIRTCDDETQKKRQRVENDI